MLQVFYAFTSLRLAKLSMLLINLKFQAYVSVPNGMVPYLILQWKEKSFKTLAGSIISSSKAWLSEAWIQNCTNSRLLPEMTIRV